MTETIEVAMMNLLWPRRGLDRGLFFDYWSGAHTQISSRLPGIHQYFQHHLDDVTGRLFPGSDELSSDTTRSPGFFGDAEITFATRENLEAFAASLSPLMNDEQNVFAKTISYQATTENVATLIDDCVDDSPNGDLGQYEKYMLYLRRRAGSDLEGFRAIVRDEVAPSLASSPDVIKVRYRLVDLYDNDAVTLLAPNVSNIEPESTQATACIEVVFPDSMARRRYGASALSARTVQGLREACDEVVVMRALRTFTVYNHGRITLAGLRTPQMAAQIRTIGAINQTSTEVEQLLLNEHTQLTAGGL
ncbi:hypothetical protein GCM10009792_20340 [Microcella alkalica]|uniref:EthD domain-containing protein n=1 Tax=Microcella alkalica TaxID=355930 RepID=A0A839E3T4_9MICO|nr:EthD domain-containing protein [Microcella alkalica]MBA8847339.1 hypothetical protein [Microcella alkalica]